MFEFLVGVDGGGTHTRAVVALPGGAALGRGLAGPSALGQGIASAWNQLRHAILAAFSDAGIPAPAWNRCGLGAGLSGVSYTPWREEFIASNIGFAALAIDTDAFATLLGAHDGKPGAIVSAGTGSIGEALLPDGTRRRVGGWGFPWGDEGSGAWLGLRAVRIAHRAFDGRAETGALARHVFATCGADRESLGAWRQAATAFTYAQLAPAVFELAAQDPAAERLLDDAQRELAILANALDPRGELPIALCGSVGERLAERWAPALKERRVAPIGDATAGALHLLRRARERAP